MLDETGMRLSLVKRSACCNPLLTIVNFKFKISLSLQLKLSSTLNGTLFITNKSLILYRPDNFRKIKKWANRSQSLYFTLLIKKFI